MYIFEYIILLPVLIYVSISSMCSYCAMLQVSAFVSFRRFVDSRTLHAEATASVKFTSLKSKQNMGDFKRHSEIPCQVVIV